MHPVPRMILALVGPLALAAPAAAHSLGGDAAVESRFALPAWVVWLTGGAVVALTFAIVAAYATRPYRAAEEAPRVPAIPSRHAAWRMAASRLVGMALWTTLLLPALVPQAAATGPPTLFWVLVWAGFPLAAYTWSDPWRPLNPFATLGAALDRIAPQRSRLRYPSALGAWPATLLLLGLIGLEVAAPVAHESHALALGLLAYTSFTLLGMWFFGVAPWLGEAEVLTRYFAWWAAAAPRSGRAWRHPATGLAGLRIRGHAEVAFTLALLFGVNYDGFLATRLGQDALAFTARSLPTPVAHAAILLLGFAAFLAAFWVCAAAMRRAAESLEPVGALGARFAVALLPIAVGYHLAHNLFYVAQNLPPVVAALVDPLNSGWWLGPAPWLAAPRPWPMAWTQLLGGLQMIFILGGHVVAVLVAHRFAYEGFPSRIQAVKSEVPLTIVMALYTLVGLWLLSSAAAHAAGAPS